MLLIFAILLMVILVSYYSSDFEGTQQTFIAQTEASEVQQTAVEGAALYTACSASTVSPGQYSPASFNAGLATTTPIGNSWGCVKTAGGVYGTLITVVTYLSSPSIVTGMQGTAISGNSQIQQNLAYQVEEAMVDRVQFSPNTIVGVIPAGSLDVHMLAPVGQDAAILSAPLTFSTPAIVGNLFATTPTNNVLSAAP